MRVKMSIHGQLYQPLGITISLKYVVENIGADEASFCWKNSIVEKSIITEIWEICGHWESWFDINVLCCLEMRAF